MKNNQYENGKNLNTRIKLHEQYSENKQNFHQWVFSKLHLKEGMKVLECGCGPGALWYNNKNKIPKGCEITLVDLSEGMVKEAKKNIGQLTDVNVNFYQGDIQNLEFESGQFDVVIANHMLHHVEDITKGINEAKRVLKKDGHFYSSTFSQTHMKELDELISLYVKCVGNKMSDRFCLENGCYYILNVFENVNLYRHIDGLRVLETEPLMSYILSRSKIKEQLDSIQIKKMSDDINQVITRDGFFYIRKDAVLLEAIKR